MATVTSRDVREIVEKLSSDKAKARDVIFLSPSHSLIADFEWRNYLYCSCGFYACGDEFCFDVIVLFLFHVILC